MNPFRTPLLIGRRDELKELDAALAAAQNGAGRCVLVGGDAGIGKSRLIAELHDRARERGFTVLTGRCFEQDRVFPYAPFIDMLRPLSDRAVGAGQLAPLPSELLKLLELEGAPSSSQVASFDAAALEKRRLFAALTQFFLRRSESAPLLLVLEDLHWSDEASLEFLLYLVRRLARHPLLLLLSARLTTTRPGLVELLAGFDREPVVTEIRLAPLTRAEVAGLLRALLDQPHSLSPEFVGAVYSLTEGNPFFAEEICTSLIASGDLYYARDHWRRKPLSQIDIPGSIQRLVQQRLDRVSRSARQLLDLAAVSGRTFDVGVLQALTGHDEAVFLDLVKEAIAAGLVVEESVDRFAFRHALTREALYGRLLARERRPLHGQLVDAIERVHAGALVPNLELLSYHTFAAGRWPQALDYGRRAGEKALALHAPHAAIEHFTRAIQAAGNLEAAPAVALYRLRGQAFDTVGDFDRAREDYEASLEAARKEGEQYAAWELLLDLALLWASRDNQRTGDYCRQALALARSLEAPAAIAHSLNRLGNWMMNSGQPQDALDYHREALALFESLGDQAGIAATLDLLAMTSNQCGDARATVDYYRRAIPILRDLDDRQTLASSLTMLSNYTLDEAQAREAVELARQSKWRSGEAFALTYLGSLLACRGDYGAGLAAAQGGLALAEEIDHRLWQAWANFTAGLIYLEMLDLDQASGHLRRARAHATEVGSGFMLGATTAILVSTLIMQRRLDEAAALLPQQPPERVHGVDYLLLKANVELLLARQEPAAALQLIDRVGFPDRAHCLGAMAYYYGALYRLRGESLIELARLDEAEAVLRDSLALYQDQGIRLGLWRIYGVLGDCYRAASEPDKAAAALTTAQASIDELATTIPGELRDNFRRRATDLAPPVQPLTPRQAAKREYGGLTRREREVAGVVARGLTNQEIAGELVVSIKTVEAHVSRILSKLGFSSRTQIATWAVDKGLAEAPQDLNTLSAGSQ